MTFNHLKLLKLKFSKSGIEKHNASNNHIEFSIILEQLILQAIPTTFIPVLLEILLTMFVAWLLYPKVIVFIDSKND